MFLLYVVVFLFLFLVLFYFVQVFGYLSEGKKTDEKKMNYTPTCKLERDRERLSRGRERGREGEREEKGEGIRAREGQD